MTTTITHKPEMNRYVLTVDGEEAGYLSYIPFSGSVDFEHTEIHEKFGGQGLSGELIRHALNHTRERDLKIMADCPVVKDYLERHQDWDDIVVEA